MRSAAAILAGVLIATLAPVVGAQAADNPIVQAFKGGTPDIDVRFRHEHVDQDGLARDADANTVRTRIGFVTDQSLMLSGRVEAERIDHLGSQRFNSTINGKAAFPVVADPDNTEINRLYLTLKGFADTVVKGGRQRINLDNARFIGSVPFRQNEQTFDALTLVNTSLPDTRLFYGYVWNVNRVFGDRSVRGEFRSNTHLFNASYGGLGFVKPSAYAYLLDFTDRDKANSSTATFGLRLTGKTAIADGWNALYTGEFAHQTDWADSAVDNSHDYYLAEVGLGTSKLVSGVNLTLKAGYEVLDGDRTRAIQMPLATLFAFNGWSDRFLGSTPAIGLIDQYASIGAKVQGISIIAAYHNFDAEEGSLDHGEEWNFRIARPFFGHLTLALRYAAYSAENTSVDIDKLWLTAGIKF